MKAKEVSAVLRKTSKISLPILARLLRLRFYLCSVGSPEYRYCTLKAETQKELDLFESQVLKGIQKAVEPCELHDLIQPNAKLDKKFQFESTIVKILGAWVTLPMNSWRAQDAEEIWVTGLCIGEKLRSASLKSLITLITNVLSSFKKEAKILDIATNAPPQTENVGLNLTP